MTVYLGSNFIIGPPESTEHTILNFKDRWEFPILKKYNFIVYQETWSISSLGYNI